MRNKVRVPSLFVRSGLSEVDYQAAHVMVSLAEVLVRCDLSPVGPGGPGPRKLSPPQFAVARQPFVIRESWHQHVPTVPVWGAGIQLELWTATAKQPLDKAVLDLGESLNRRVLRLACWLA